MVGKKETPEERAQRVVDKIKKTHNEIGAFMGRNAVQHMAVDLLSEEGAITIARLVEEFQKQLDAATKAGQTPDGINDAAVATAALDHLKTFGPGMPPPSQNVLSRPKGPRSKS